MSVCSSACVCVFENCVSACVLCHVHLHVCVCPLVGSEQHSFSKCAKQGVARKLNMVGTPCPLNTNAAPGGKKMVHEAHHKNLTAKTKWRTHQPLPSLITSPLALQHCVTYGTIDSLVVYTDSTSVTLAFLDRRYARIQLTPGTIG